MVVLSLTAVFPGMGCRKMTVMPKKYAMPPFLVGCVSQSVYEEWLRRKASAHVKRDRKRGNAAAIREAYRIAIHTAVLASGGNDFYTGESLEWERISTYRNDESKARRREYKRELAMLPTVDHVGDGLGAADFRICAWRTNDCKNDLTADELVAFCRRVIEYSTSFASN